MKKFKNAFEGLKLCIKDKAIMVQIILGLCAIIGGFIISLDYYEWMAFIICIGCVIVSEIVNTCIERLCDLYKEEYDLRIKRIKDMSSAFVLVSAIMALIICIFTIVKRIM